MSKLLLYYANLFILSERVAAGAHGSLSSAQYRELPAPRAGFRTFNRIHTPHSITNAPFRTLGRPSSVTQTISGPSGAATPPR